MDDLSELREIRIHKVIGLDDNGRRQSIPCPFHNEKNPSLSIYPDNSYYCFGCSISGQNAIDFLLETGEEFKDVIEELKKYI